MGSDVLLYWEQQDFDYWCHEDLSNDNDAAGKVQTEVTKCKPETVIVNGGGKINSDFIKAILYRIDDKITITTLTLALLL